MHRCGAVGARRAARLVVEHRVPDAARRRRLRIWVAWGLAIQYRCSVGPQAVACSLADIAAGAQVSVRIDELAPAVIQGTSQTVASVSSAAFDPNLANNAVSTAITPR